MLVRFKSTATESILMFGDIAVQLIRMLGATGAVPGALFASDIPAAMGRLRAQLQMQSVVETGGDEDEEKEREPPIALAVRAEPLLDILQRAAVADAPVMWEKA